MSQWSNCSSIILVHFGPGLLTCVDLLSVTTVTCIRAPSHDSQLEVSPYQVYGFSTLPPALQFENQSLRRGVAIRPSLTGKEFRLPSPSQLSKMCFFVTFPHVWAWFQVNEPHGPVATVGHGSSTFTSWVRNRASHHIISCQGSSPCQPSPRD
jgi:hypothetical protein